MSIKVALRHVTSYNYDRLIQLEPQTIRLKPAPHTRGAIDSYSLAISPNNHFINWQQDPFGNYIARCVFPEKTNHFKVTVDLVTHMQIFNPFDFFVDEAVAEYPFKYDADLLESLAPYLEIKESGKQLTQLINQFKNSKSKTVDFLVELNSHINQMLTYIIRLEPGVQTSEETLEKKSGSCRDMAWLLCQALRHLGLASRFTSGYLIQLVADIKPIDGPAGPAEDFTDLHAWTEVFIPGAGWIGLDPTSGLLAGEGHIPLCCTPNPTNAAPISGSMEECESTLHHEMSVIRIHEDKRVTKPYQAEEWDSINTLGEKVDRDLIRQDVRLTMGGEPTFVSAKDRKDPEWQYQASGPQKEAIGKALLFRLKEHFAPGGLAQFSQGKWYPGEILPRWSFNCYWRLDGEKIWIDKNLLADKNNNVTLGENIANEFLSSLASTIGVSPAHIHAAYEDAPYHLWKEHKLPIAEEVKYENLYDEAERKRLQKIMESGLSKPFGYVLPLAYSNKDRCWLSNKWEFKTQHLILTTGDSPIGMRLPINSLPPSKLKDNIECTEIDLFSEHTELPTLNHLRKALTSKENTSSLKGLKASEDLKPGRIKTALATEIRDNQLCIFLPPTKRLEHFLELVAAIELTAEKLNIPVLIEGYGPPKDIRLENFSITPDPGVLEVNIQPAHSWKQLVNIISTVYQDAHELHLSTQKFMIDGKCIGTEGGSHIVIGGPTPSDSPFLRRPDLLRSMLTFWQHHPSLSYLFSSTYIGPTSQSPRVDEARNDSLYELEIAFKQLDLADGHPSPWLIDRLFRNILIDVTGNTHRSEFCIDKLFSPDNASGRLGLLELRNFEMPPHPQMNLLQALLIRALISVFWNKPYKQPLIRWGTLLHDKFMLPHYVWQDFRSVLHHLKSEGYNFDEEWFLPFYEFRFPSYGSTNISDLNIELRSGLEPWSVLGEEVQSNSVSRSVDSSVERVQLSVRGTIPPYLIFTCNGRRAPLHATGTKDLTVAGVRFKAWNPHSSLHPTIDIQAPLVFDIVDTRYQRSIGGFTYHAIHPGGRNYETAPVNANEAEGRRLSRFQPGGHTSGKINIPPLVLNDDFPYTLDLRYTDEKEFVTA